MAREKRSVSCCGIHYPLARQFFTAAGSSGPARSSSGSHQSQFERAWGAPPGEEEPITFLPHSPTASPNTVTAGTAPIPAFSAQFPKEYQAVLHQSVPCPLPGSS